MADLQASYDALRGRFTRLRYLRPRTTRIYEVLGPEIGVHPDTLAKFARGNTPDYKNAVKIEMWCQREEQGETYASTHSN